MDLLPAGADLLSKRAWCARIFHKRVLPGLQQAVGVGVPIRIPP